MHITNEKFFYSIVFILCTNAVYSQEAELWLYYPSYSELEKILTSPKSPDSVLQESSPLPYTPSYDLVEAVQNSLKVSQNV